MPPKVSLRDVTAENWRECVALEPTDDQRPFLPSNAHSLAQACYEEGLVPLAVYSKSLKTMVGFAMYAALGEGQLHAIVRMMVDQQYAGEGYDLALLKALVSRLSDVSESIFASYAPENTTVAALYAELGFVDEGMRSGAEIVVRLPVK